MGRKPPNSPNKGGGSDHGDHSSIQAVYGHYDKKQIVSVMGPSGRVYAGNAFCCLKPQNTFRLSFIWLVEQPFMETATPRYANSAALA